MRLLEVEDDELLGSALQRGLKHIGYAVDWVQTGADAKVSIATHDYDAVLLDLGLPDMSGEALLKDIRARRPNVCVVVMTARHGVRDRIALLDIGADDYMVKPVDLHELSARLRAVSRRVGMVSPAEQAELGPLKMHPEQRSASWYGRPIELTNKEYQLLEFFVRRRNQILTRAQLEESLYGWGDEIGSNAVEVYVHFLRRKFASGLIRTIRGVGYQLSVDGIPD